MRSCCLLVCLCLLVLFVISSLGAALDKTETAVKTAALIEADAAAKSDEPAARSARQIFGYYPYYSGGYYPYYGYPGYYGGYPYYYNTYGYYG